jgi:thiamine transport system ATP-binding protein
VLRGPAATRVLAAGGLPAAAAVAVRRSALSVDREGALAGEVVSARATPDLVRLVVDVDEVGRVDAVARSERHPGPGERVRLAVDPARLAAIPAAAMRESSLD